MTKAAYNRQHLIGSCSQFGGLVHFRHCWKHGGRHGTEFTSDQHVAGRGGVERGWASYELLKPQSPAPVTTSLASSYLF